MNSPLTRNHDEQHIRETAYHLWEKDGRPLGHAERYWEMALRMSESPDEQPSAAAAPIKAARAKKSEQKASPAKSKKSLGRSMVDHIAL
jgi:hypothetical protein